MSSFRLQLNTPQAEQLTQLVELDRLCLGGLWTRAGYQRELDSPNSHFLAISLEPAHSLIGCGCFWEILEEAHITLLMIHPDHQRQGLGQLLLYSLLRDAAKRNLERATLEVRVSNQPALALYEKFGFRLAGRRKGYYQETGEDALILWRGDLHQPSFQSELSHWQQTISDRLTQQPWQLDENQKRNDRVKMP